MAYPRASDAVHAMVEVQQALAQHIWPGDVAVRVRMGLHTGEPLQAVEGYVGMDVHRAAHVAHIGHGGQVLWSSPTTAQVIDDLPAGIEIKDLGRHLLKDLQQPKHIQQPAIFGQRGYFPPLTSLATIGKWRL